MKTGPEDSSAIHRRIWRLAGPMIISNISLPLLGLVDTAILGHLNDVEHLGAVSIGASILAFCYWGFGFLRMGTTGLAAQAFGAGDAEQGLAILLRAALLGLGLATLLLVSHRLLIELALLWMSASDGVSLLARHYLQIRFFSAPAVLVTFACIGWLIGQQNTRLPLLIVVSTNLMNILLDCVFIIGLGLGSQGAALATLISEYAGCLLALAFIVRLHATTLRQLRARSIFDSHAYLTMLRVNRDLFIRTICLLFSLAFFTAMGARLGDNVLAANAILMQLIMLSAYGMDGFAHAVEALSGKAVGAGDRRAFYQAAKASAQWSLLTAVGFSCAYALAGPQLGQLFTDLPEVLAIIHDMRHWIVVLPLITVWSYWLDGIFIGSTQNRPMRDTMVLSVLCVYLPIWYCTRDMGNTGLWLAFFSFSALRSASLGWVFWSYSRQQRWFEAQPRRSA